MKILFLAPSRSPWIEKDLAIIQKVYPTTFKTVLNFKDSIEIVNLVIDHDLIFCWFGSFRFFIPLILAKLTGKHILIVTGGYDVAGLDEISYGAFSKDRSKFEKILRKKLFSMATRILPVSISNQQQCINNASIPLHKCSVVPLYVESRRASIIPYENKKNQIILIANIPNFTTFKCKGIDIFIEIARLLPHFNFKIMGKLNYSLLLKDLPNNLYLIGPKIHMSDEFISEIQNSMFAIQPSRHESFCSSAAEAASLGTMPIGPNHYGLAEVLPLVGGKVVSSNIALSYAEEVKELSAIGYEAERISELAQKSFNRTIREERILEILKDFAPLR